MIHFISSKEESPPVVRHRIGTAQSTRMPYTD